MQELLTALETIEKPGSFCTFGNMPPCFLGLNVNQVGSIGLPLTHSQAEKIISQCHQAPFGRGEKTLVDTNVRRVWELEPEHFSINNPQWHVHLKAVTEHVKEDLGLSGQHVDYELYKMLLYQEGDFFVPHRDTEKMENMFATLVVVLPSEHRGGELLINHDGRTKKFVSGGKQSAYDISYAAFYADCEHEVKPVTEGYRLCLVYNLALKNVKQQPTAPQNNAVIQNVAQVLKRWEQQQDDDKLVLVFEHHYSEAGLSFQTLKNFDKAQANVLQQAAQEANCDAYLGLLTRWESGDAEYGGYYYDDDDPEMGEIYDSEFYIDYWIDKEGNEQDFGKIEIIEDELLARHFILDVKADKEEIEEATGNAGASIERWYHRAAIVIWRKRQQFAILAEVGQQKAVGQLEKLLASATDDAKQQVQLFAQEIINQWRFSSGNDFIVEGEADKTTDTLLGILIDLDNINLIQQFISQVLVQDYTGLEGEKIVLLAEKYGWETFTDSLLKMAEHKKLEKIANFTQLLSDLVINCENNSQQKQVVIELAEKTFHSVKQMEKIKTYSWIAKRDDEAKKTLISGLFKVLSQLGNETLLDDFCKYCVQSHKKFDLYRILIPVLEILEPWVKEQKPNLGYQNFLAACHKRIKQAATKVIKEPTDWLIKAEISCNCEDCADLKLFLQDANTQEHRFRVRKDRRQHLHRQIDSHKLDIDHVTERKGSPQTLVCTKNRNSYHAAKKQQALDIELLAKLEKMK